MPDSPFEKFLSKGTAGGDGGRPGCLRKAGGVSGNEPPEKVSKTDSQEVDRSRSPGGVAGRESTAEGDSMDLEISKVSQVPLAWPLPTPVNTGEKNPVLVPPRVFLFWGFFPPLVFLPEVVEQLEVVVLQQALVVIH